MINSIRQSVGNGRCIVEAVFACCGKDVNVTIGGGEKYHIGAVAIAVPRFELKDGQKRTASTSVVCVQDHREDELAYKSAKYLATELDCTVVVTIGIHLDNIEQEEFQILLKNVNILLDRIVSSLR